MSTLKIRIDPHVYESFHQRCTLSSFFVRRALREERMAEALREDTLNDVISEPPEAAFGKLIIRFTERHMIHFFFQSRSTCPEGKLNF